MKGSHVFILNIFHLKLQFCFSQEMAKKLLESKKRKKLLFQEKDEKSRRFREERKKSKVRIQIFCNLLKSENLSLL